MLRGLLVLLVAFRAASCEGPATFETEFEVLLKAVERLSAAGAVTTVAIEEVSSADRARNFTFGRFTDGGLNFGVRFLSSQIEFEITNGSGTPATIPWDKFAYLDVDGNEHHGFTSSVTTRSAIGPGKRLHVLGAPTDFTTPVENGFGVTGILRPPSAVDPVMQKSREQYCGQIGKALTVRLPVSVNDELRIYSMHFAIADIVVTQFRSGIRRSSERWAGCS